MQTGSRMDRWERASHTWRALVDLACKRETREYGELGEMVGQSFALAVRHPLALIYWHCEREQLPPLTVLVVNKQTGLPSSGFGKPDRAEFERLCEEVFLYDWTSVPNPFGFSELRIGGKDPVRRLIEAPDVAEEVYSLVRDRGGRQIVFRRALLDVYRGRCAFSGSMVHEGLEAAHIVPWSQATPWERLDVRNGILLTSWHHRLFDAGLLSLDEDYRIRLNPRLHPVSRFDQEALNGLEGTRIHLPKKQAHRPDPELIRKRNRLLDLAAPIPS